MIIVSLENIKDLELPLDTTEKVVKRGNSKRILKELEKKYNLKSHLVCQRYNKTYVLCANVGYNYVPDEKKEEWIENYKTYVKSSVVYKFWIAFYKLFK